MLPYNSEFRAPWWCRSPHLQTIWPYLFTPVSIPSYRRQRLELADGDFLDIDWIGRDRSGPIVLVIHGLAGSSESHYIRRIALNLKNAGMRCAIVHHRGCSGVPNRLPRGNHAGDHEDLSEVINSIRIQEPDTPLFALGYSLGGCMLVHWLNHNHGVLHAACAVSIPLELNVGAERMQHGVSKIYQKHLLASTKKLIRTKAETMKMPVDLTLLGDIATFREFDDVITAPLHGFKDADDYYKCCSPRRILRHINTPSLIIHAADDPLMSPAVVPNAEELPSHGHLRFELSEHGGHCGFVQGAWPTRATYWLDQRIVRYFGEFI